MTEQELRELKIKTLEAYGYSLEKDNNGVNEFYRLWDSKGQRYLGVNFDSCTEAWDAAPDVTRSLDACAPLKKDIYKQGFLEIESGEGYCTVKIFITALDSENIYLCIEDTKHPEFLEPRTLCLAYCKFKELTTKGEEHHG